MSFIKKGGYMKEKVMYVLIILVIIIGMETTFLTANVSKAARKLFFGPLYDLDLNLFAKLASGHYFVVQFFR